MIYYGSVKYRLLYKASGLRLIICGFLRREMALNIILNISLDTTKGWKSMRGEAGESSGTKAYTRNDETSRRMLH
jgi:hypothetical protein